MVRRVRSQVDTIYVDPGTQAFFTDLSETINNNNEEVRIEYYTCVFRRVYLVCCFYLNNMILNVTLEPTDIPSSLL